MRQRMRWAMGGPFALVIAIAASTWAPAPATAAVCAMPADQAALDSRALQSHLMVAALSCEQRDRYNVFVRKFDAELGQQGRALKQFFDRAYGGKSSTQFNRFITNMANEASRRAHNNRTFCGDAAVLFDTLQQTEPPMLAELVSKQPFAGHHGFTPCSTAGAPTKNDKAHKAKDDKVKVEKAKGDKPKDEKPKDEKAKDEKAKDEKAKDEKAKLQKAKDDKASAEKAKDEQPKADAGKGKD